MEGKGDIREPFHKGPRWTRSGWLLRHWSRKVPSAAWNPLSFQPLKKTGGSLECVQAWGNTGEYWSLPSPC
jgi:hypothetical protein